MTLREKLLQFQKEMRAKYAQQEQQEAALAAHFDPVSL